MLCGELGSYTACVIYGWIRVVSKYVKGRHRLSVPLRDHRCLPINVIFNHIELIIVNREEAVFFRPHVVVL